VQFFFNRINADNRVTPGKAEAEIPLYVDDFSFIAMLMESPYLHEHNNNVAMKNVNMMALKNDWRCLAN
jgi:hypothetical protein